MFLSHLRFATAFRSFCLQISLSSRERDKLEEYNVGRKNGPVNYPSEGKPWGVKKAADSNSKVVPWV